MQLSVILLFLQLWANMDVSLSETACSKLPDVPKAHVSEESRKSEYQEGNEIYFTCETGYISGPTITYICTIKGWLQIRGVKCYLKPCVLPEDTPNGYYQMIHGDEFVFGTTIKYMCNEGYQMVSKADTRTCLLDQWSNHLPICESVKCVEPAVDGELRVRGLPENDGPILADRFLTFSCDTPGKYLSGSSRLTCGKDGEWSGPFPSCEDVFCEAEVMHPSLIVTGLPPANETMKHGHKLTFQCNGIYALDGVKEVKCLQTGRWNAHFPTCEAFCRFPDLARNVRIANRLTSRIIRRGTKLRLNCQHGQYLHGMSEVECLANGQWSESFPTCGEPMRCQQPPSLDNGDIKSSMKYWYNHGETVEYLCQNYYRLIGHLKTCNNGEWIGEVRCLKPCTVTAEDMRQRNIGFRYTYANKLYSEHGDEIQFVCIKGSSDSRLGMRQRCNDGVMLLPSCH
ncbi:complement factor H-related protein 1-like [Polymixia lowei]